MMDGVSGMPFSRSIARPAFSGMRRDPVRERIQLAGNYPGAASSGPTPRSFAACVRLVPFCLAAALLATAVGCRGKQQTQSTTQPAQHLDFNQDVQPILASNCFSCHGPDPEMRKAGLRLDLEESAFKKRPGHPDAIVPGHP